MPRRQLVAIGSLLVALAPGCAVIQSNSISEITKGPGHRIWARDSGHGFFMLTVPELDAVARLKAQCEGGVTGIHDVTWVRNWLAVQHYQEEATGWCQNN